MHTDQELLGVEKHSDEMCLSAEEWVAFVILRVLSGNQLCFDYKGHQGLRTKPAEFAVHE